MDAALITLGMGIILGYLAQRSRICFIGGLRDFILVRDTELVKGAIAFFITAWLAFSAASYFGWLGEPTSQAPSRSQAPQAVQATPQPGGQPLQAWGGQQVGPQAATPAAPKPAPSAPLLTGGINWGIYILALIAGVGLGFFSTLANGCPTRQHVLAAQGVKDSAYYLAGFYLGVVIFYLITKPLLAIIV